MDDVMAVIVGCLLFVVGVAGAIATLAAFAGAIFLGIGLPLVLTLKAMVWLWGAL